MTFRDDVIGHQPAISEAIARCGELIKFPWEGLPHLAAKMPGQELPLIGYGSLLSLASAAQTIAKAAVRRQPCVCFGCRRLFNYEMPVSVQQRYGIPTGSPRRAALNVEVTRDPKDYLNGIITSVTLADLPGLRKREFGYDLALVPYFPWDARGFSKLSFAYILTAPNVAAKPEWQVVRNDILPEPDYSKLCADGAASISEEFGQFYLETTYMADKRTTLKDQQL